MAQLYTEKGVTDVAEPVTISENNLTKTTIKPIQQVLETFGKYEEEQEKKFARQAQQSLELYQRGMENLTSQSMKQLYNDNKNDPLALQKEFDKLSSDVIDTIPDSDTRINVKAKYLLDSQTYLNQSKNNLMSLQKRQLKQRREEAMFNNLDLYSSSIQNVLSGSASADDFANLAMSKDAIEKSLSAKDEHGLYEFTPHQQRQMKENLKKIQVQSAKDYFNNLSDNDKKVFMDNFDNNVSEDVIDNEGKYQVREYMKKVMKKAEGHEDLPPEIAMQKAIENTMADDDISEIGSAILDSKGKMKKDTDIADVLAWRGKIQDYYNDGTFNDKDYQKNIAKTIKPLMQATKDFSTDWLNKPLYQKVYKNVLTSSDGKALTNLSDNEKAYILSESYNRLAKADLDPKSTSWGTSDKVKEIAKSIQNDYLINKDNGLLTKQIDRVIMGTNVYDFTEGKANVSAPKNYKVMQSPDGGIYKVFFINGEPVQRTRIR